MTIAGAIVLTIGTLIVVVPARDGIVIVADSKSTRRTGGGSAGVGASEKVFELAGVPGHAFFVTGVSPVEWIVHGQGVATVVDARGVVRARLSGRGSVSRGDLDAVANECAKLAARIHHMGPAASPLVNTELFTVGMARAGSNGSLHEVGSFVVRLTPTGAEVTKREWARSSAADNTQVFLYGEGAFVAAGIGRWRGGSADCARAFLESGNRSVQQMDAGTAARGAYSIQEAASTAMGDGGTVGPPFRAYVLTRALRELPPVAPCR